MFRHACSLDKVVYGDQWRWPRIKNLPPGPEVTQNSFSRLRRVIELTTELIIGGFRGMLVGTSQNRDHADLDSDTQRVLKGKEGKNDLNVVKDNELHWKKGLFMTY